MKITIVASNGAEIVVWREHDTFSARRAEAVSEPQICLAVDLFEVIAELAELDLERADEAAEALALSQDALRRTHPGEAVGAPNEGSSADASAASDTNATPSEARRG
jgi:hypothetical protein